MTEDAYPIPPHGWTCFHCGDHFPPTAIGQRDARRHFGATPDRIPLCHLVALTADVGERSLAKALRIAERERDEMRQQRDRAEEEAESASGAKAEVLRLLPGARSVHDIRNHIDSLEGRVQAAELILASAWRIAPGVMQAASADACGPGTYYPPMPTKPRGG